MTCSTDSARGSRRAGAGGRTSRDGSPDVSPSRCANRCSPRTATTARPADVAASGRWSLVALAQRGEEVGDVGLAHGGQVVDAAGREPVDVAAQVAPVGQQGVGRQPALDREVVEVGVDDPRRGQARVGRGHGRRGQTRTSSSGAVVSPCASATGS